MNAEVSRYDKYSIEEIVGEVVRAGYQEVEKKALPNLPIVLGYGPILFTPAQLGVEVVADFECVEVKYYWKGQFGIKVINLDRSSSMEEIDCSAIVVELYWIEESKNSESRLIASATLVSSSKGPVPYYGIEDGKPLSGDNLVEIVTALQEIELFLRGLQGIVPKPSNS